MKKMMTLLACVFAWLHAASAAEPATTVVFLSGVDAAHPVDWEFYCTDGRKSGEWTTIPVPSNWEMQGFGEYNYGHDLPKANEEGRYRHSFEVPADWKGKRVRIVFDGVMTDTAVRINGASAGEVHQGGFYRFRYDITELLKYGEFNTLEVDVKKVSDNASLETAERKADYWVFGGIYREVFLEVLPASFIDRCAINAQADGSFEIDVFPVAAKPTDKIEVQIQTLDGVAVGTPISAHASENTRLATTIAEPKLWTAETPDLYQAQLTLVRYGKPLHRLSQRFGFRTIEIDPQRGILLNGTPIRLRGVNRHCHMPQSGRAVSRAETREDLRLIKAMNMNAVRCAHYPPDKHMLEMCDELGLYVINELCTWQKPAIETKLARKLVKEMIERDVNHPSILMWANGNEGGENPEVDGDYHMHDPQQRPVIHPWKTFSGIDTKHYTDYGTVRKKGRANVPYLPTEFLHGMFDGGAGAGLDDYWTLMRSSPRYAGGFLWAFAGEGIVRTDRNGEIDVDGNHAPDGIVGPYREKEGSYDTIREIFCPVQAQPDGAGHYRIENRYHFSDLDRLEYRFNDESWQTFPATAPGEICLIPAPQEPEATERLQVRDWTGELILDHTRAIANKKTFRKQLVPDPGRGQLEVKRDADTISVGGFVFDAKNLRLISAPGSPLSNGPRLAVSGAFPEAKTAAKGDIRKENGRVVLELRNTEGLDLLRWTVYQENTLKLEYSYRLEGKHEFFGVTFDLPEEQIRKYRYTGYGPSNVWKNRLRGTSFGTYEREWSDCIWGKTWNFPLAEGYFGEFFGVEVEAGPQAFAMATDSDGLFLRMGTHDYIDQSRGKVYPPFPEGNISVLHAIPAIGTKFKAPDALGPQGKMTRAEGTYSAVLHFRFGVQTWPQDVQTVQYPASIDDSLQPMLMQVAKAEEKRPLLVGLHTWSGDYTQAGGETVYARWCQEMDWHFIHPDFRGPNWTPEACGSEMAVQDIIDAVEFMKKNHAVDEDRIYLAGVSGGGYMSLLMAGRAPELWAGVTAWVPISDLRAWWKKHEGKKYANHIEQAVGGNPETNAHAAAECIKRSALTYLDSAAGVNLDINAGVTDGHQGGSVPFSHSLHAFNQVVPAADQIAPELIEAFYENQAIPAGLERAAADPLYGSRQPIFRRISDNTRVTIFDGRHEIVHNAALNWLAAQSKASPAQWQVPVVYDLKTIEEEKASGQ